MCRFCWCTHEMTEEWPQLVEPFFFQNVIYVRMNRTRTIEIESTELNQNPKFSDHLEPDLNRTVSQCSETNCDLYSMPNSFLRNVLPFYFLPLLKDHLVVSFLIGLNDLLFVIILRNPSLMKKILPISIPYLIVHSYVSY